MNATNTAAGATASDATKEAKDSFHRAGEKLREQAGEQAQRVLEGSREALEHVHQQLDDAVDSVRQYLGDHDVHEMVEDATKMIRRYPLTAVLAGVALGYLIARGTQDRR